MTLEDLYQELLKIKIPVAHRKFKEGSNVKPPYIVYYKDKDIPFRADGKNYFNRIQISIELYTENRNRDLEKQIRKLLENHGFLFDEFHNYLSDEMMYEVLFETIIH